MMAGSQREVAKNLLIVESPAKAKTIKRYLGSGFQVAPSVGHVMDLPRSKLGVDLEHDFMPEYEIIKGKNKVIEGIKKAAKESENIYLATDPDREGEAIAWHVAEQIGDSRKLYRVLLHEITPTAVRQALANPSELNRNLYEAQQARRVLDRLVGYQISPLLWQKVRQGISAGRVQSVALRIIVEREREREAFRAEEYWTLDAKLEGKNPPPFKARLFSHNGRRVDNKNYKLSKAEVDSILAVLKGSGAKGAAPPPFNVSKIERKEVRRSPVPPFITSRLQQEAARRLYFSPSRTMKIAQKLYEGVEIGDQGAVGLITYMRTDSVRVSDQALNEVREYIAQRYGANYVPEKPNYYKSSKSAQEAHEAIRPTSVLRDPESLSRYLARDELALYTLIFNRFVSSQMPPAVFDRTTVDIVAAGEQFRATGQVMKFDGFIRVYLEGVDDAAEDDDQPQLPQLEEGEVLRALEFFPEQHFTQPPPRFTQATLIKELEENGIGRPSTYASIMTSILNREYVDEDESKRLRPTSLGRIVNDLLVAAFPDIVETGFTAHMEEELDQVEEGKENWVKTLKRFYSPFKKRLGEARKKMPQVKGKGVPTGLKCELDGGAMVIKFGRNGEFLACSNYPDCENTKEFARDEQGNIVIKESTPAPASDQTCEKCGKPMVVKRSRFGEFLGCSGYPECNGIKRLRSDPVKTGAHCPECDEGEILERRSRRGKLFYGCSRYPKCTFASWNKVVDHKCPKCGSPYLVEKTTKRNGTTWSCAKEECDYVAAAAPSAPAESSPPPSPSA
jgi:DNA topoisomerase I